MAHDAEVRITDYVDAKIGTDLGPRLLAEASRAATESRAAAGDPSADPNDQLQKCLVAILCAHAAVEAQMNAVGDAELSEWWPSQEPKSFLKKWRALSQKRTGKVVKDDDAVLVALVSLNEARNEIAHFRGLKVGPDTYERAGPPVTDRGGISPVRARFDAALAETAVATAEEAFKVL